MGTAERCNAGYLGSRPASQRLYASMHGAELLRAVVVTVLVIQQRIAGSMASYWADGAHTAAGIGEQSEYGSSKGGGVVLADAQARDFGRRLKQVAPVPAPSGTVTCTLAWASTAGPSPPLVMSHGPYHATNTTNQGCTSVQDIAAATRWDRRGDLEQGAVDYALTLTCACSNTRTAGSCLALASLFRYTYWVLPPWLTTVRTYSDTGRTMPPLTASDCTASQCVRRYYVAEGINPAPFSHAVCYNVTTDTFLAFRTTVTLTVPQTERIGTVSCSLTAFQRDALRDGASNSSSNSVLVGSGDTAELSLEVNVFTFDFSSQCFPHTQLPQDRFYNWANLTSLSCTCSGTVPPDGPTANGSTEANCFLLSQYVSYFFDLAPGVGLQPAPRGRILHFFPWDCMAGRCMTSSRAWQLSTNANTSGPGWPAVRNLTVTTTNRTVYGYELCFEVRPRATYTPQLTGPANPIGVLQCSLQLRRPQNSLALGASPVQAASRAFPPVSFLGTGGLNTSGCAYVGDVAADGSLVPQQEWWAARSADVAVEAYGMDVVLSCKCYNRTAFVTSIAVIPLSCYDLSRHVSLSLWDGPAWGPSTAIADGVSFAPSNCSASNCTMTISASAAPYSYALCTADWPYLPSGPELLPPARSYDLPSCDVQLYSTYDSNITISYPPVTGSSSLLPYIPESYRTAYPNATRSANGTCWDNPTLPELQQQQQNASTAADVSGQFAVVRCRCTNNQQDRNCYQDTQAIAWFYSLQGPGTGPTEGSAADAFTFSPWHCTATDCVAAARVGPAPGGPFGLPLTEGPITGDDRQLYSQAMCYNADGYTFASRTQEALPPVVRVSNTTSSPTVGPTAIPLPTASPLPSASPPSPLSSSPPPLTPSPRVAASTPQPLPHAPVPFTAATNHGNGPSGGARAVTALVAASIAASVGATVAAATAAAVAGASYGGGLAAALGAGSLVTSIAAGGKLHTLANLVAHTQFLALTGDAAAPLGAAYANIASHLQWINFRYDITGLYGKSSTHADGPANDGPGAGADAATKLHGPSGFEGSPSAPSMRDVIRTGKMVEDTAPRAMAHPARQLLEGSWGRGLMQLPDGPPAPQPGGGGDGGAEGGGEEQDQEDAGDTTSAEAAAYNTLVVVTVVFVSLLLTHALLMWAWRAVARLKRCKLPELIVFPNPELIALDMAITPLAAAAGTLIAVSAASRHPAAITLSVLSCVFLAAAVAGVVAVVRAIARRAEQGPKWTAARQVVLLWPWAWPGLGLGMLRARRAGAIADQVVISHTSAVSSAGDGKEAQQQLGVQLAVRHTAEGVRPSAASLPPCSGGSMGRSAAVAVGNSCRAVSSDSGSSAISSSIHIAAAAAPTAAAHTIPCSSTTSTPTVSHKLLLLAVPTSSTPSTPIPSAPISDEKAAAVHGSSAFFAFAKHSQSTAAPFPTSPISPVSPASPTPAKPPRAAPHFPLAYRKSSRSLSLSLSGRKRSSNNSSSITTTNNGVSSPSSGHAGGSIGSWLQQIRASCGHRMSDPGVAVGHHQRLASGHGSCNSHDDSSNAVATKDCDASGTARAAVAGLARPTPPAPTPAAAPSGHDISTSGSHDAPAAVAGGASGTRRSWLKRLEGWLGLAERGEWVRVPELGWGEDRLEPARTAAYARQGISWRGLTGPFLGWRLPDAAMRQYAAKYAPSTASQTVDGRNQEQRSSDHSLGKADPQPLGPLARRATDPGAGPGPELHGSGGAMVWTHSSSSEAIAGASAGGGCGGTGAAQGSMPSSTAGVCLHMHQQQRQQQQIAAQRATEPRCSISAQEQASADPYSGLAVGGAGPGVAQPHGSPHPTPQGLPPRPGARQLPRRSEGGELLASANHHNRQLPPCPATPTVSRAVLIPAQAAIAAASWSCAAVPSVSCDSPISPPSRPQSSSRLQLLPPEHCNSSNSRHIACVYGHTATGGAPSDTVAAAGEHTATLPPPLPPLPPAPLAASHNRLGMLNPRQRATSSPGGAPSPSGPALAQRTPAAAVAATPTAGGMTGSGEQDGQGTPLHPAGGSSARPNSRSRIRTSPLYEHARQQHPGDAQVHASTVRQGSPPPGPQAAPAPGWYPVFVAPRLSTQHKVMHTEHNSEFRSSTDSELGSLPPPAPGTFHDPQQPRYDQHEHSQQLHAALTTCQLYERYGYLFTGYKGSRAAAATFKVPHVLVTVAAALLLGMQAADVVSPGSWAGMATTITLFVIKVLFFCYMLLVRPHTNLIELVAETTCQALEAGTVACLVALQRAETKAAQDAMAVMEMMVLVLQMFVVWCVNVIPAAVVAWEFCSAAWSSRRKAKAQQQSSKARK